MPSRLISPSKKARTSSSYGGGSDANNHPLHSIVLMEPTEDRPWLVDVVSALPKALQQQQEPQQQESLGESPTREDLSASSSPLSHTNAVSRSGRWTALVSSNYGSSDYSIHVWYTVPSQTFQDQKFHNPVLKLQHPKFMSIPLPPLISLQSTHASTMSGSSEDTATSVYLYVVLPSNGSLFFWKFNSTDLRQPVAPSYRAFAMLQLQQQMETDQDSDVGPAEVITCLQSVPHHLLAGTSSGRVFWVRQTQNALHQETLPYHNNESASGASSGFFSRLLFGSGSTSNQMSDGDEQDSFPFLTSAIFLKDTLSATSTSNALNYDSFATVTRPGQLVFWNTHRANEHALSTTFSSTGHVSLRSSMATHLGAQVSSLQVLQVAAGPCVVHILVRAHVSPLTTTPAENEITEDRLYWLRVEESVPSSHDSPSTSGWSLVSATWLDRFPVPNQVEVVGLEVAANGVAYCALVRNDPMSALSSASVPILMAHDVLPEPHLYEVDLLAVVDTKLLGLFSDDRTYGCNLATASGTLLRAECKEATEAANAWLTQDQQASSTVLSTSGSRGKVASLLNHLRSTFYESYQHPSRSIVIPPSIQRAERSDLEQAIFKLAQELQRDILTSSSTSLAAGTGSSSNLVMSRHLTFVLFLQDAGIYRTLLPLTKWHLMAMGQEIAAYDAISTTPSISTSDRMRPFLESLTSFDVANWLESVQLAVLQEGAGEDRQSDFYTWLERALAAAINFRNERGTLQYDISATAKPPTVGQSKSVPVWTSKPTLQKVLSQQITHWVKNESLSSKIPSVSVDALEVVVAATLCSYRDEYNSVSCETTKLKYSKMLPRAIHLLRKVAGKERDAMAWSLSKSHTYFGGLCQIAYDHRKDSGSDFKLEPFFKKYGSEDVDIATGLNFGKFVIKWFIDRNLFGEALKYGGYCENDLLVMINSEQSLKPYRWIVSMQRGDFEGATRNLMSEEGSKVNLAQAKFNLAMAKLSNKIVMDRSVSSRLVVQDRAREIENRRELAQAQEQLFGKDVASNAYPWTAEGLLNEALNKMDRVKDRDSKAETVIIALCVCAAIGSEEQKKSQSVRVWYKTLMADWDVVDKILHEQHTLTDRGVADTILQKTLLGHVVDKSVSLGISDVGLSKVLDRLVADRFDRSPDQSSVRRLLSSVLAAQAANMD